MILTLEMMKVVHREQELLLECAQFESQTFNFGLAFILVRVGVIGRRVIIAAHVFQICINYLNRVSECGHVKEVNVDDAILVNVSLTQEASRVLEKTRLAEAWHTINLNNIVFG